MKLGVPSFLGIFCLMIGVCGCGTKANVVIRVTEEDGSSIPNARLKVGFVVHKWSNSKETSREGTSDINGLFAASGTTDGDVYFNASKPGYYESNGKSCIWLPDGTRKSALPGGHRVDVILKRIIKPVPMYAKYAELHVPATNTPVSYDMQEGDWLPPFGKGKEPDLVFNYIIDSYKLENGREREDTELTVTFSRPGDGLIALAGPPPLEGSELKSPHEAPQTGYQAKWVQYYRLNAAGVSENNVDTDRIYLLRLRTVLDQDGNVVSANYGKIYGDFNHEEVACYFNPEINDRNLEFNRSRNLASVPGRTVKRLEFP